MENIPGIDPVLKVLLQEEGNAVSQAKKSIDSATQKVIDAKDTVAGYFGAETKPEERPAPAKGMVYFTHSQLDMLAYLLDCCYAFGEEQSIIEASTPGSGKTACDISSAL